MSLWRTARGEVAGAWRSLRYDLQRRSDADPNGATGASSGGEADGTERWGVDDLWGDAPDIDDEFVRPARPLVAVTAFGLLALVGAAASYFAVVSGLGLLLTDAPGPDSYPLAAEAGPAPLATGRQTPASRLGNGSAIASPSAPQAQPRQRKAAPSATPSPRPSSTTAVPLRTVAPTGSPCRCSPPPISTYPTYPRDNRPSGYPSASVSPSPSVSAVPSASPFDDGYQQGGRGGAPRSSGAGGAGHIDNLLNDYRPRTG